MPELNSRRGLHLELVGVVHHGDLLLGIVLVESRATGSQSHQGLFGFGEPSLLDEPPGTLGSERDTESDRQNPHPLNGEGDLVGPLGFIADQSSVDTGTDDLSDNPKVRSVHDAN